MKVSINIQTNIRQEVIQAFEYFRGEATEEKLREYILAFGVTSLELMLDKFIEVKKNAQSTQQQTGCDREGHNDGTGPCRLHGAGTG